jgi:hypothetical protein
MIEALRSRSRRWWIYLALFAIVVTSFGSLVVFSRQANADQCSINGRDCYVGYFSGAYDGGPGTLQHNVISAPALLGANNADDLVNNIRSHMACVGGNLVNGGAQNATGAAFIVLTMLGYAPGTSKDVACQVFDEWAATVREWAPYTNYNVFYDFGGLNTRSSYTDVAYYPSVQSSAWSIVFYNPANGQPLYGIKKDCANPVGRLQRIPRNYSLTPRIDTISPTQIESGNKMSVTSSVDNTGEVNSQNSQWEITKITVKPGKKAPHEDEGPTAASEAPCQGNGGAPSGNYFQSGDASCQNVGKGSGVFDVGSPAQNLKPGASDIDIGDIPVGTRVCFALSVQPRANNDGNWAHSKPICTVVGKKPKVQVWGGDLGVRGKIETSTSVKAISGSQRTFGSWVEYGAFSVGANNRFASGSGLVNQISNDQDAWSNLTFANRNDAGAHVFGQYTTGTGFRSLPNIASFFSGSSNKQPVGSGSVDLSSISFGNGEAVVVRTANDVTITSSNIPAGRSVVIVASGTVTIDGDISYANGPFTDIRQIPQVVIIAENIHIKDGIGHIDAWLVANNIIDTCYNVEMNQLTSNKCNVRLEVNGPIVTNRLILKRTAGSDTGDQSGDPAERFNLRPDAYLWASFQARGSNKAQTVYTIELPPRF